MMTITGHMLWNINFNSSSKYLTLAGVHVEVLYSTVQYLQYPIT
jgi:hypothetical protein